MEAQEILDRLEEIIDKTSLQYLLEMVSEVCNDKAIHINDNWQDGPLANCWEVARDLIDDLSAHQGIKIIS